MISVVICNILLCFALVCISFTFKGVLKSFRKAKEENKKKEGRGNKQRSFFVAMNVRENTCHETSVFLFFSLFLFS